MSYCRWSSDNFNCDLYCYEDVNGGWTTHIAGNKPVGEIPKEPEWPDPNTMSKEEFERWVREEYLPAHNKQMEFLDTCERKDIELPHAGETFNDGTLEEFKERLLYLRGLGYRFPDYVLETVDEELKAGGEE